MFGTISLIIMFLVLWWYLVEYIKYFNTGDPNETDINYWKFSYDFKPSKKEDFSPDKPKILKVTSWQLILVFFKLFKRSSGLSNALFCPSLQTKLSLKKPCSIPK